MSYFANKSIGLKADIKRHREREVNLMEGILDLERVVAADPADEYAQSVLRLYRTLYCKLLESKAAVTDKIGKKKS